MGIEYLRLSHFYPLCGVMLASAINVMGRKKNPTGKPDEAYRKQFKPVRIKMALAGPATAAANDLAQDFTQYVNDALRMRLQAEGRWPPKPPAK